MDEAYAQALWELVEKGMEPKKAVASLKDILERAGRVKLLPQIGRAFLRIAERERAQRGITLYVGKEKEAKSAATEAAKVLQILGTKAREFDVEVDDSLIGGWRLEGAGVLVDTSFKKQLLEMYNRATS